MRERRPCSRFPYPGIGFVGVALSFGLTVLTMAYAVGHISGIGIQAADRAKFAYLLYFMQTRAIRGLFPDRRETCDLTAANDLLFPAQAPVDGEHSQSCQQKA
jgi:hypothetical protein